MARGLLIRVAALSTFVALSVACAGGAEPKERSAQPTTTDLPGDAPDPLLPVDLDLETAPVLDDLGIPNLPDLEVDRVFTASFEDEADLAEFYATPQTALTHHELSNEQAHSGSRSHKGWVTGVGGAGLEPDGPNHRGYPTVQLHKLPGQPTGGFRSPTITELWVWVDISLQPGQWLSFATFTPDASDRWARVVTVNLDPAGYVNIFHAPRPYEDDLAFQRTDLALPLRQWVRLTTYLDLSSANGAIAVWQDGVLVSASRVDPGVDPGDVAAKDQTGQPPSLLSDRLEQAHFGLYAAPDVASGLVYNDDLTIAELAIPDP